MYLLNNINSIYSYSTTSTQYVVIQQHQVTQYVVTQQHQVTQYVVTQQHQLNV